MKTSITLLIAGTLLPGVASAAVVVATGFQNNGTTNLAHTYVVSSTDLLNGLTASASTTYPGDAAAMPPINPGSFTNEGSGGLPVLTNGLFAPITRSPDPNFDRSGFATGGPRGGTSVTYTLAMAASIASIDVYGGWQDGGRDHQSYTVLYALAGAPTIFIPLETVNFNPTVTVGGTPVATKTTISEDTTGILAANVIALRFDFTNTTQNNYSGYSEIDVFAVPEPSSVLLGGLGLLGLVIRRRR